MSLGRFVPQESEISPSAPQASWSILPPFEEVVEGCHVFIRSYFQLGFLPKTSFFERLQKQRDSISVFLLTSILCISARFTPSLVRRYGNGQNATNTFLQKAAAMMPEYMYKPSLEAIQSFFLISLAEWGKGDRDRSSTHMGIAVRMAGTLRLHREETYRLPENATADEIVESEVARRTFWMLENHDNLHSGYNSPVPFSLSDITTLLPCEEQEFAFGIAPRERAALIGTASALDDERLTKSPSRSLFATLIQCHNIWGQIARRVARNEINQQNPKSLVANAAVSRSEHLRLMELLRDFEDNLPVRHRWSVWNLRGFRAEKLDLAYLSVVTMIRLSNIILRRTAIHGSGTVASGQVHQGTNGAVHASTSEDEMIITKDLFSNMVVLNEQIDAFFSLRSSTQGFPAFIIYCVYICGTLANHLQKSDNLAESMPEAASRTAEILAKSTKLLSDLQYAWPMTKRWSDALLKAYQSRPMTGPVSVNEELSYPDAPATQGAPRTGIDDAAGSNRVVTSNGAVPAIANMPVDSVRMGRPSETDMIDLMLDDPWHDEFSGVTFMDNLETDLAFNLWPGDI